MLPIQSLQRHDGSVNTLLLYGDFLFSGSEDKEIKVGYQSAIFRSGTSLCYIYVWNLEDMHEVDLCVIPEMVISEQKEDVQVML